MGTVCIILTWFILNSLIGEQHYGDTSENISTSSTGDYTSSIGVPTKEKPDITSIKNKYHQWQQDVMQDVRSLYPSSSTENTETSPVINREGCTVHFIDVGQGNAVIIESEGHFLLYDGGNYDTRNKLYQYMDMLGITRLDYLICSHYDADHIAACSYVLRDFEVDCVIEPDYKHDTTTYGYLIDAQEETQVPVKHPSVGDQFSLGDSSFMVICPVSYDYVEGNNNSVGIRLTNGIHSVLLTGDAELESELDFTEYADTYQIPLESDVLLCGHHGGNSSTSNMLLDRVKPQIAVISVGIDNEYGHPRQEVLDRLNARDASVYRTDQRGTIVIDLRDLSIFFEK